MTRLLLLAGVIDAAVIDVTFVEDAPVVFCPTGEEFETPEKKEQARLAKVVPVKVQVSDALVIKFGAYHTRLLFVEPQVASQIKNGPYQVFPAASEIAPPVPVEPKSETVMTPKFAPIVFIEDVVQLPPVDVLLQV